MAAATFIAHRLTIGHNADRIVIDDGGLAEKRALTAANATPRSMQAEDDVRFGPIPLI
jgi:hypothetical protein